MLSLPYIKMQCVVCNSDYTEKSQWPCNKCYKTIYCSKECRKQDRENHNEFCISSRLEESLERFADKLVDIKAFKKCFVRFFGGPSFCLVFSKEELRKIEQNPTKNMPLILSRLDYNNVECAHTNKYHIRIECENKYTDRLVDHISD